MTTIRKEPTVSLLTKAGEFVGIKVRGLSPDDLVADALESFSAAEQKMNAAIEQLDQRVADEEKEIRLAEKRIETAENAKSRLTRVIDRLKALTE